MDNAKGLTGQQPAILPEGQAVDSRPNLEDIKLHMTLHLQQFNLFAPAKNGLELRDGGGLGERLLGCVLTSRLYIRSATL
ncbi:hypothetical protein [Stenotrophomonas sp. CFBP 13718]|uniref:hypothetical protein n=1 Tax=Stenotrophomonas sp. CFBP 13718 TaxID=2775304 RepID=UPI00177C3D2B|nr:hypothetical protein [Stenotrophomonas sp. CFBP 13718]MBD8694646.1 hypothetical protein [Stenotrophomonas sp. CFBP 13718]